jgi:hypothetical protein
MSELTRNLSSAVNIRYHNIGGTISGNEFNLTHNISDISFDVESLRISALLDWSTAEFAKNFGLIFKETFGPYIGPSLVPGWTIFSTGPAALVKNHSFRHGSVSISTITTAATVYISKRIVFPPKLYSSIGGTKKSQAFDIYVYVKTSAGTAPKIRVSMSDPATTPVVVQDWTSSASPVKIEFDSVYEKNFPSDKSFNLDIGITTGATSSCTIELVEVITVPKGLTVTTDDIPYVGHKSDHDIGKEGFIVSFDVSDGSTTKKYVFRGCAMSSSERMAAADDVSATLSFVYKNVSVGETWT